MSETLSVCKGACPTMFEGASKTADELRTTLQKLEIAVNKVSGNILRVKKDMDALQSKPEIQDAFFNFLKKKYDDEELKEIGGKRTMSSQRRALYRKFQGASKERSTLILTDPAFVTYLYSVIPQSTVLPLLKELSQRYTVSLKRLNSLQKELDTVVGRICALK